ncbi:MAG: hypothetical protein JWQ27_94 [Ferruginibacter sp.]|nr:hypothetical protein [Ferruginibacter sp.]
MNMLFSAMLMLLIYTPSFAQKPTCQDFHEGSFSITTAGTGTTMITRTKKQQIEESEQYGYKLLFDIVWTDECTYELRPKKVLRGDPAIFENGKIVLRTRIKQITNSGYTAETSSNFSPAVMEFEVRMLK